MSTPVAEHARQELARITTVLNGWETQPHGDADWLPGDPIHPHPYSRPALEGWGGNVPRPMFELLPDWPRPARCEDCDVSWSGEEPCWVCGVSRPWVDWRPGQIVRRPGFATVNLTVDMSGFARAMARAAEQIREVILQGFSIDTAAVERFVRALAPPSPPRDPFAQPVPLSINGREYNRRRRARHRRRR